MFVVWRGPRFEEKKPLMAFALKNRRTPILPPDPNLIVEAPPTQPAPYIAGSAIGKPRIARPSAQGLSKAAKPKAVKPEFVQPERSMSCIGG